MLRPSIPPLVLALCAGCLESSGPQQQVEVEIGVPDDVTGLEFVPLDEGGDIPLESFGQGGTHASLAVRCIGFGNRAFVDVTLENLETGETAMTAPASRPQLLLCRDEETCDLIPLHVLTGGLAPPDEKDGLAIGVTAEVRTEDGLVGTAEIEGVLRRR